jgi:hypothetical protein
LPSNIKLKVGAISRMKKSLYGNRKKRPLCMGKWRLVKDSYWKGTGGKPNGAQEVSKKS